MWQTMRRRLSGSFILLGLAILAASVRYASAGSEYVIVSANPESKALPLGTLFVPGDVIRIPAGTDLTLLSEDGSISSISGPAAYMVTEESLEAEGSTGTADDGERRTKLGLIAGLLTNERERTESLGSSRTPAIPTGRNAVDNPWTVSIEEPGPACIRNDQLVLSRPEVTKEMVFSLVFGKKKRMDGLVWKAGEPAYAVSEPVPHGTELIVVETNKKWVQMDVKAVPADVNPMDPVEILAWMIDNGCRRQALAFTNQLGRTN
jgi:hypothetical protein